MNKNLSKFVAAAVVYIGFAVYLYQPYFKGFNALQLEYFFVINVCLASLGCFVLSQRWVVSFWGSIFAGALYGFGPFVLGLAKFHPTAGLLAATVPWLFCPAAFGPKAKWRWLSWSLSALPFLAILLFFQISPHYRLFAIPIQAKLHLADLAGLLAPLVMAKRSLTLIGFYHVPVAALVMGIAMLLAAKRYGVIVVFCVGTGLAFWRPVLNVSPVIWLTIPSVCCSILIGEGLQGLCSAGWADRRWVLMATVTLMVLSIVTLLLATKYFQIFLGLGSGYAKLLVQTARMYILGAIATAIIFFLVRTKVRVHWLRLMLLSVAMAIDIFLGA